MHKDIYHSANKAFWFDVRNGLDAILDPATNVYVVKLGANTEDYFVIDEAFRALIDDHRVSEPNFEIFPANVRNIYVDLYTLFVKRIVPDIVTRLNPKWLGSKFYFALETKGYHLVDVNGWFQTFLRLSVAAKKELYLNRKCWDFLTDYSALVPVSHQDSVPRIVINEKLWLIALTLNQMVEDRKFEDVKEAYDYFANNLWWGQGKGRRTTQKSLQEALRGKLNTSGKSMSDLYSLHTHCVQRVQSLIDSTIPIF